MENNIKSKIGELKSKASLGGGAERIEKHHSKGAMTARERILYLVDNGSFEEIDMLKTHRVETFDIDAMNNFGDGVVIGNGTIDGRRVFLFAFDSTIKGGSLSEAVAEKICKSIEMSAKMGVPIIGLWDSGGARIQEGVLSLGGCTDIFFRNVMYSGVVPQISGIFGPCAGAAVYSPALTDFIFMVEESSYMYLTGPGPVKKVTGEVVTHEELGGASVHSSISGVAHFVRKTENETLDGIRRILAYIPSNNLEDPPIKETNDPPGREELKLESIIPDNPNEPYDIKEIIYNIIDDANFMEVQVDFAKNIIVGFCRLNGKPTGVIANQPNFLAGVLDIDASIKASRFVRFCDCFNIPILTLVDVPGFMPGTSQEYNGIIRNGAKLLFAYAEATVPKVTVVTRKTYGGAYCVMSPKHMRGDFNYAWPTAELAVIGAEGAIEVIYRKEVQSAPEDMRPQIIEEKIKDYRKKYAHPFLGASRGFIDDIIEPKSTRFKVIRAFEMCATKNVNNPMKKHGNVPL